MSVARDTRGEVASGSAGVSDNSVDELYWRDFLKVEDVSTIASNEQLKRIEESIRFVRDTPLFSLAKKKKLIRFLSAVRCSVGASFTGESANSNTDSPGVRSLTSTVQLR